MSCAEPRYIYECPDPECPCWGAHEKPFNGSASEPCGYKGHPDAVPVEVYTEDQVRERMLSHAARKAGVQAAARANTTTGRVYPSTEAIKAALNAAFSDVATQPNED